MIRINKSAVALSIAALTTLAAAEPVVVAFPVFDDGASITDPAFKVKEFDSRLPDLLVGIAASEFPGVDEVYAMVENNVPNWWEAGTSEGVEALLTSYDDPSYWVYEQTTQPGTAVPGPDASGDWADPGVVLPFDFGMPFVRFYDRKFYDFFNCDYSEVSVEIVERSPVLYYPIRIESDASSFNHGWFALQAIDFRSLACDSPCSNPEDISCMRPAVRILGFGYETEVGTPITVGGGLCPADVNFDAVLDLGDLQTFVAAFVAQSAPADFDGNGIFDLADVQGFVGAFNTNCGL